MTAEELPEGWTYTVVGEVSVAIQYGFTASAEHGREGPRFLRITDIQDGRVEWGSVPGCEITDAELKRYDLRAGDIVFARTGATTGKSFLIRQCPVAVFASYLIRLRHGPVILPEFLSLFFKTRCYAVALGNKRIVGKSRYVRTASRMRFFFASYQLTPTRKQCDSSRRNARNANPT